MNVRKLLPFLFLLPLNIQAQNATTAVGFVSTNGSYWRMQTRQLTDNVGLAQVVIRTDQPQQTMKGWGTCFNELDYDAMQLLSAADRDLFVKRAFNPNGDLRLTVGRISVGASDYANDWYSCDETAADGTNADGTPNYATDFSMEHFTIERDLQKVIPSIKLALAQQPAMTFWASPWSPPQWMKTNKHYAQRRTDTNWCPFDVPPLTNNQFIDNPDYYNAYCLYFDKFIQAYKGQGINITGLAYQNEAYSYTPYPGCSWKAATTAKFLGKYLGPYMAEHQPDVSLIVGTFNTNNWDVYNTILSDADVSKYCKQVGLQWEGGQQISNIRKSFPDYELVQTESECGSGTFDWNAAAHTFQLCNHYLANGVTSYTYWNAILKDLGYSTWGWRQNALVQVSTSTNKATYCPEFYAYKHYTHFIPAGSKILTCDEKNLVTSALTPDGNVVVIAGNDGSAGKTLTVDIDGKALVLELPAKSFSSYVVGTEEGVAKMLKSEALGLVDIEGASLTTDQTTALNAAISANTYEKLLPAIAAVQSDAHVELLNPSFTSGADYWTIANVAAGGDFKAATIMGKPCYNNWSNNFTSLDVHQDLNGLTPGLYNVSAKSLCGEGNINDQHVYAETSTHLVASPVKADDVWSADHWETQTTETIYVAEGDYLRVGYASTSGGGTKGWFCVTDFVLTRVGELGDDFDLSLNRKPDPLNAAHEAYQKVADDARLLTVDEAYDENERAALADLIESQKTILASVTTVAMVGNLQRELEAQMEQVRASAYATSYTPSAVGEGTFLLYDVNACQFLNYNGNSAALSDLPTRMVLSSNGENTYAIKYVDKNYLKIGTWNGQYMWTDATSADHTKWIFTPVTDKANTYLISAKDYDETAVSGTYYINGGNASTVSAEAHEFILITPLDYIQHTGDASFMLQSPVITSATNSGWLRDNNNASGYAEQPAAIQSDAHTGYGISHWAGSARTNTKLIYQTVSDLPAGTYRLEAYAAATVWNNNNGTDNRTGVTLFAEGITTKETAVTTATYAKYTVYYTLGEGEELTVGLRAGDSNQNNWIFLSDVTLTYCGNRLVLDENYHEAPEGTDVDVLLQRTFREGWNTVCLPFGLTATQLTDLFGEDAKVATFVSAEQVAEDIEVTFQKADATEANEPFLLYVPADRTINRTIKNVDCSPVGIPCADGKALSFMGTYAAYANGTSPINEDDYIIGEGQTFRRATEGEGIKAYHAYLISNLLSGTQPDVVSFRVIDDTAGVTPIRPSTDGEHVQYFDLIGRRIPAPSAASSHAKGIYIVKGAKVIVH